MSFLDKEISVAWVHAAAGHIQSFVLLVLTTTENIIKGVFGSVIALAVSVLFFAGWILYIGFLFLAAGAVGVVAFAILKWAWNYI